MSGPTQSLPPRLWDELRRNLSLHFFEDREIDETLSSLEALDPRVRRKALALCLALSSASSNLVPRTLRHLHRASAVLSLADLDRWVTNAFDLLDTRGIESVMVFLARDDAASLRAFASPAEVRLDDVTGRLQTFARALVGRDMPIAPDTEAFTDSETIFLPESLAVLGERGRNFLLYRLSVSYLWAMMECGTIEIPGDSFARHAEPELARDLFAVIEGWRLDVFLRRELPGIMREAHEARKLLHTARPAIETISPRTAYVEGLYQLYLAGETKGTASGEMEAAAREAAHLAAERGAAGSLSLLAELYERAITLPGPYDPVRPLPFYGVIRPEKVADTRRKRLRAKQGALEAAITRLLSIPEFEPEVRPPSGEKAHEREVDPARDYLAIKGRLIELDEELREAIEEGRGLPGGVLVKGSDLGAGARVMDLADLMEEDEIAETAEGGLKYDEWDYRRGGYRTGWCSLFELDVHQDDDPFVERTLVKYGGYVSILKRKFESLRRAPRLLRRQRDGDDIDIDAAVEAFCDSHAGLAPSEDVFVRLDRAERDVAALFLLDMSGSTKGWINEAEKESLVLLCEALESLGDRYAIYGFSGMTRNRCEFYRIKSFGDAYGMAVKGRIAGIAPHDYTRMGPPLRHASSLLGSVEARTRLLLTLSDGRPEDYDAYKGDYGMEDTRRALAEAREKGIHPFCITIDREASEYLPRMFGETGYVFIDDVRRLPGRITEIYRTLTT